ncbi:MAG TPA: ABC transporter substrate-binding protein [Burkholderiales bacterium]|nr:ABC transporter substrate-binding protein [Burkholderiales bacterium]
MPPAAAKLIAAVLGLAALASAAAQGTLLRYGQAPSAHKSVYSLPSAVAQREGFFQAEGVDFRLVIPIDGGADRMIAELHAGTIDVTHVATPFLVRAALAGSDAVAIAAEFNDPIYSLIAQPGIARIADLKGKTVGLADPGGSISYSMRKLLALHGLGERDIEVKMVEGTPARLGCLRRADCAAVPLGQPQDLLAQSEGFRLLGRSNEAVPPYLYTVTAARRSWAAANTDTAVRYVKALARAFRFIDDPQRRDQVAATLAEITGVSLPIATKVLALYAEPGRRVLPRQGEIDLAGLRQVIAFMGEAAQLEGAAPQAERFVDLRYLALAGIR